jgi:hypothetical protein
MSVIVFHLRDSRPWEVYLKTRSALETPGLLALSAVATLIAGLVGTVFGVILAFPFSLLALIFFPVILGCVILAAVLAAPVTFGLFPLTYHLMRGHPILAQFAIPLVGFVGGGTVILIWIAIGVLPQAPHSHEVYSAIGMVSGLSAGAFFVRGLYA